MGRPQVLDYDLIVDLYVNQRMSLHGVAGRIGCQHSAVFKVLKKLGVPRRSVSYSISLAKSSSPRGRGTDEKGYERRSSFGVKDRGHRRVAAYVLGRSLRPREVVHHCNEIKSDNRPENLWVFPDLSSHMKYHKTGEVHPDTIFLKDQI